MDRSEQANMTKICQVCRLSEYDLISLDAKSIITKLSEFIVIDSHEHTQNICVCCWNQLHISYSFKLKCDKLTKYGAEESFRQSGVSTRQSVAAKIEEPVSADGNPFSCTICNRSYKSKGNLETHIRRHSTSKKIFQCDECGLQFLLQKHLDGHTCTPDEKV